MEKNLSILYSVIVSAELLSDNLKGDNVQLSLIIQNVANFSKKLYPNLTKQIDVFSALVKVIESVSKEAKLTEANLSILVE